MIGVFGLRGLVLNCGFVNYAVQSLRGTGDLSKRIEKKGGGVSVLGRGRGIKKRRGGQIGRIRDGIDG